MKKENVFLKIWRVIYPLLMYLGISIVVQIPFTIVMSVKAVQMSGGDMMQMQTILIDMVNEKAMLMTAVSAIITMPIVCFLMHLDKKNWEKVHGVATYTKTTVVQWILIAVLAVTYCIAANNWISVSRIIELFPGFEEFAQAIYGGGIIGQILAVGIIAPIVEEFIFRGLAYQRIKRYSKPITAMILSALLFGLFHMNVVQGIYAFGFGLLAAYTYEKFHTVWAPVLFHVVANIISVFMTNSTALKTFYENNTYVWILTIVCTVAVVVILVVFKKVKQEETIEMVPVTNPVDIEEEKENNIQ